MIDAVARLLKEATFTPMADEKFKPKLFKDMLIIKKVCKYVICLPTEHQGVHKNSFRNFRAFQDRIGIWKCWFFEEKTGVPGEKPLGTRKRNSNKLNPHMTPDPRIEPRTHWWKASALTNASFLLPIRLRAVGLRS